MSHPQFIRQTVLTLGLVFTVVMSGWASPPPVPSAAAGPAGAPRAEALSPTTGLAMQFRSAGHVLGFTPEGMLVAGRDHLLKVNFVGAAAVTPEAPERASTASEGGEAQESPTASTSQGAPPLTEVRYRNLWPGIELRYDGHDGIARSTYTLAPGASVADIRLAYNVAAELTDQGGLTLTFATGTLSETAPIAWQEVEGKKQPVTVAFHQHANGELGFTLGDHDPALPLTIDPTLSWNTFLGGAGFDVGRGIATDTAGNVYVTGTSSATWGAPVRAYTGGQDAFVARLTAATGALVWNTFLGGAGFFEVGRGIATDTAGNVYVAGYGDATWGAPVRAYTGGLADAFVARLTAATGALVWNTFLGGAGIDSGPGIATDTAGNVYVTGASEATWGAPVRAFTGVGVADAFVARLTAATGVLVWNTFLGGAGFDEGTGIATDTAGNVYVSGDSSATWGAPVRAYTGGADAFVARLTAATGALVWNTFLGGAGSDIGSGIATDTAGNVYVTGMSTATWGAPVRAYTGGGSDAFVARLTAATGALGASTFLGGAGFDEGTGIATDTAGNVYVTGASDATWGAPVRAYTGGDDAFVARLTAATGALGASTFLGGAGSDIGSGIATDTAGNVYVSGESEATWGAPVRAYTAGSDAFVARLEGVGGGESGPLVNLIVNGGAGDEVSAANPVTVTYRLRGCQGREMFLVLNAPPLGILWSYLNAAGQWVPLPPNLADIMPFSTSGPADGSYPLFMGNVPVGDYELYLGCDFAMNGHLDYQVGAVNGVYDHIIVHVR